jgi:beta-galactosidase GanA
MSNQDINEKLATITNNPEALKKLYDWVLKHREITKESLKDCIKAVKKHLNSLSDAEDFYHGGWANLKKEKLEEPMMKHLHQKYEFLEERNKLLKNLQAAIVEVTTGAPSGFDSFNLELYLDYWEHSDGLEVDAPPQDDEV